MTVLVLILGMSCKQIHKNKPHQKHMKGQDVISCDVNNYSSRQAYTQLQKNSVQCMIES
jgi:hypothetical protein